MSRKNRFSKTAKRRRVRDTLKRRTARLEQLETRLLLASDWQNQSRPLDVNNSGQATALDAILVINRLAENGLTETLGERTNRLDLYYDVNGDNRTSAVDAIQIINGLGRAEGEGVYSTLRVEGESEPAPTGFISTILGTLPGGANQQVELTTEMMVNGAEEFHEMGFFVVDTEDGHVDGLTPDDPGYPEAVFANAQRTVAFSRMDVFQTERSLTFDAGVTLGVYILQGPTDIGDSDAHIRVGNDGGNTVTVGWEQHAAESWIFSVGDRAYDDAIIDVHVGEPFDGNAAPTISAIADRTVNELTELSINVPAFDADLVDGDELRFQLDDAPDGVTIDQEGVIRWTPTEEDGPSGPHQVVVRTTDLAGAFATREFNVSVLEVNSPPIITEVVSQSIDELQSLSLQLEAADSDLPANTLSFALIDGPEGVTVSNAGLLSWTPTESQGPGDYIAQVQVDDGAGGTDATDIVIQVNEVNSPPTIAPIDDQRIDELTPWQFTATGTDLDNPAIRSASRLTVGQTAFPSTANQGKSTGLRPKPKGLEFSM